MHDSVSRLVLVHGSLGSVASWSAYPRLLPDLDVSLLDLPGHGSNHELEFSTASALGAIGAAVDDGEGPVVLAGHSLGGYLAALWAHHHPGRLAGLVLMGASGNPRGRLAGLYKAFAGFTRRADHQWLARRRQQVATRLGVRAEQLQGHVSYDVLPVAWQSVFDDCPPWIVTTLDVPVLYLNGQFDQMRMHEKQYVARTTDARLRIVKGATHFAPLTHEREVASQIRAFVGDVALR